MDPYSGKQESKLPPVMSLCSGKEARLGDCFGVPKGKPRQWPRGPGILSSGGPGSMRDFAWAQLDVGCGFLR